MIRFKTFLLEKGQTFGDESPGGYLWNVGKMFRIAKKITRLQDIPLISLIDKNGILAGDSDEDDESPEFFDRVSGLDLDAYKKVIIRLFLW